MSQILFSRHDIVKLQGDKILASVKKEFLMTHTNFTFCRCMDPI